MDFIFRRKYNQQSQICIISREHDSAAFGGETESRKYQETRGKNNKRTKNGVRESS